MVSIQNVMQTNGEMIQKSVAKNKIEFVWEIRKLLQNILAVLLRHDIESREVIFKGKIPQNT